MDKQDYDPTLDSRYNCDKCEDSGIDIESREYCEHCQSGARRCNNDKFAEMLRGSPFLDAMWTMNQATMKSEQAIAAAEMALLKSKLLQAEQRTGRGATDAWQPIETAPRDGTQIILSNGESVAEGWYMKEEPYIHEIRDEDGRYVDQVESDGWDNWMDCDGGMLPDPTHWMPLPAPPAASVAQANKEQGNG